MERARNAWIREIREDLVLCIQHTRHTFRPLDRLLASLKVTLLAWVSHCPSTGQREGNGRRQCPSCCRAVSAPRAQSKKGYNQDLMVHPAFSGPPHKQHFLSPLLRLLPRTDVPHEPGTFACCCLSKEMRTVRLKFSVLTLTLGSRALLYFSMEKLSAW